jgi:hypothetical protein
MKLSIGRILSVLTLFFAHPALAESQSLVQGIYLTQTSLENTAYLNYLIQHAKSVGITSFVIDLGKPSKRFAENINLVKNNNIDYIARIVVFPEGGKPEQIASEAYWEKRFALMKAAVGYGANQIQLDYIRYNTKQPASHENALNIMKVVRWYKERLAVFHVPLQADVFGIASFGESKNIGQNVKMFAESIDALCPMVYPSHFEPYKQHAVTPYETIFSSLMAIRGQFDNQKMPVKLYAYIELSNYRYPLSSPERIEYIKAQIKAVKDAGADGWFAWSAHNKYEYLFHILENVKLNTTAMPIAVSKEEPKPLPTMTKDMTLSLNRAFVTWPQNLYF